MNQKNIIFTLILAAIFAVVFSATWYIQYRFTTINHESHPELYEDTVNKLLGLYFSGECIELRNDIEQQDEKEFSYHMIDEINECYNRHTEKKKSSVG